MKGTLNQGLTFNKSIKESNSFIAFSDSDWVSDPDNHRLTTKACIFLAKNLI